MQIQLLNSMITEKPSNNGLRHVQNQPQCPFFEVSLTHVKACLIWTKLTSNDFLCRWQAKNFLFQKVNPSLFSPSGTTSAHLNSHDIRHIINLFI